MRKVLPLLIAVLALPSLAAAGEVEVSGFAGYTFPFYTQSFTYDPGPITLPIADVSIQQAGAFQLTSSGGAAFGGSIALFPADTVGFEFRIDRASISVTPEGPIYRVHATLPAPLPPVDSTLDLTQGTADLSAAMPFSLNLKLRSSGHTRVYASGGISYLGDLTFTIQQTMALGVTAVNLQTSNLEIGTILMKATPSLEQPGSKWGGNLGLGFQIPLGDRGGLYFEGRGFYFSKRTMQWESAVHTPLGELQTQLLQRLEQVLQPVSFKPWWVQATVGFSYRF